MDFQNETAQGDGGNNDIVVDDSAQPVPYTPVTHRFEFSGTGGEYFRIWIVNIMLTILTLGIYSAWAKVRSQRWLHGHTSLADSAFRYHAKPLQILIGRVIAVVVLLVITIGANIHVAVGPISALLLFLIMPWVTWRSMRFNARMASWRNVHFALDGGAWPFYKYLAVIPFATVAVFGLGFWAAKENAVALTLLGLLAIPVVLLLLPIAHAGIARHTLNNYRYGSQRFSAEIRNRKIVTIYGLWACVVMGGMTALWLIATVVILIVGAVAGAAVGLTDGAVDPSRIVNMFASPLGVLLMVAFYLTFVYFSTLFNAVQRSRIRQYLYAQMHTGDNDAIGFRSRIGARSLAWVQFSNLLLMLVTLGLGWPWARVRMSRFEANNTELIAGESLAGITAGEQQSGSALGDELGDVLDVGFDVGI